MTAFILRFSLYISFLETNVLESIHIISEYKEVYNYEMKWHPGERFDQNDFKEVFQI